MTLTIRAWVAQARTPAFRSIIANAASLGGTTLVTAGLGYLFWILAARQLPTSAVGFAGAAISAMTLLGTASTLGFGTLLIRELPKYAGRERLLLLPGVTIAGAVGTALGTGFAVLAPAWSDDLAPLGGDAGTVLLFGVGVGLTAVTLVVDQALLGLSRGVLQLVRNALFAATKLGMLALACVWVAGPDGQTVYATWTTGNVLSLAALAILAARIRAQAKTAAAQTEPDVAESRPLQSGPGVAESRPLQAESADGLLRRLGRAALSHHALNIALQAPYLVLPIIATTFLSATVNAYFYIAWVLAGFIYIGPGHLATALYAAAARTPAALTAKVRFTLWLGLLIGAGGIVAVFVGAGLVLQMFGDAYADQAAWSLRILSLWAVPLIVKDHYVVLCRVQDRAGSAAIVVALAGVLEVVMASIGATMGGLYGLAIGWLLAGWLQSVAMLPTVYRAAIGPARGRVHGAREVREVRSTSALHGEAAL
jgi:O-antigen/teichoic acid export membrane protein